MKKEKSLNVKLSSYSAMAIALVCVKHAQGQMIYTDVVPDYEVEWGNDYYIDMDDDGINDFSLYNHVFYGNINEGIKAYDDNEIVGYSDGVIADFVNNYASVIDAGISIGPALNWLPGIFASDLSAALWASHDGSYGLWNNVSDKYVGLRFIMDGSWHYGWARLNVTSSAITIKDYAYNSLPNQPINTISTAIQTPDSDFNPILIVDDFGVTIHLPSVIHNANLVLYDVAGKLISVQNIQRLDFISMTDYSAGIYIIEIMQGEEQFVKRILWK